MVGFLVFVIDIGLELVSVATKNKVSPSLLQSDGAVVGEVVEFCLFLADGRQGAGGCRA